MLYNSFDNPGLVKVLSFLKSHDTEYLSGQDLSDVLHISRVAVWKHIKKIKELGYKIESKQKLGYRLAKNTELLLPWEITTELKTKTIGKRVYYYDSVDSTQRQALDLTSNEIENGTVIIAEKQTGGKGRMGRKWVSPKGGIWLSIILQPKFDISMITLFPIAASVALSKAIESTMKINPELKWPNDLMIKGKKIAGMLMDASIESNRIENVVLGVGINFNVNIKQIEKNIKNSSHFYGVESLRNFNKTTDKITLVKSFLIELEKIYNLLAKGETKTIIGEWMRRSATIGRIVEIKTDGKKIKGKALKIDDEGALVLLKNKKNQRILVGDTTHLR